MSCGEVRTTDLNLENPNEEGMCPMAALYSTKVTASGGRHGSIRSEDGLLDLKLALPRALGGRGDATNPEQLFAGGYAACFENALLHVSRDAGHRFADDDVDVLARIDLSRNETGAFVLAAALAVTIAGMTNRPLNGSSRVLMASARTRMRPGAMSMWRSPSRSGEPD
jgi:Ohr subfamily peroxiredoxin